MKSCGNCKKRCFSGWDGMIECCFWYEIAATETEEIESAKGCEKYEEGTPDCLQRDEYCPSATAGDYSPSSPWNAPGGRISDYVDGVILF